MSKHLTAILAAGATIVGLAAAPAQGALPQPGDPTFAVPDGKIEHRVVVQKVEGSKAIPSHTRTESWLTRTRSHTIVTDLRTGRLRAETVSTPTQIRIFSAADGVVRIERRTTPGGLVENSALFEAAVQKAYVEQGITKVVGERIVDGRRALVTRSVEGRWRSDEPTSVTTALVDAETFALYERTTALPDGRFSQTQSIRTETLDATPAAVRATMAARHGKHARKVTRTRR